MDRIANLHIVDDDNAYQFLAQIIIEETELVDSIKTFSTGLEAINFLKTVIDKPAELPEMILLDINMPIMDGWGFLSEYVKIKDKLAKRVTIYIVSSSTSPADMERAKRIHEVADFITKPASSERFTEMVKSL